MESKKFWSTENNLITCRGEAGFFSEGRADLVFQNGFLQLAPGKQEGVFTDAFRDTPDFTHLTCWWNGVTPAGTNIEVQARVRSKGRVSHWLSWGPWCTGIGRASVNSADEIAGVDADELTFAQGNMGDGVQLRIILRGRGGVSPLVFGLGCTFRDQNRPADSVEADPLPEQVLLPAPLYSQMVREDDMGPVMCSAVTATLLINHQGLDLLPEQLALVDYDMRYEGYGNWAFTMAAASAFGYETCLQYGDLAKIRSELSQGRPVGMNVTYSNTPEGKYHYLKNGAANNTPGHLMTVVGYETVEGVEYFIAHDSAAIGDENCCRRYRADQLERAWTKGMLYLLQGPYPYEAPYLPYEAELILREREQPGLFSLETNGEALILRPDFYEARLKEQGGGIVAYAVEEDVIPLPDHCRNTSANRKFYYDAKVTVEGRLQLPPEQVAAARQAGKHITLYIMDNDGLCRKGTVG